MQPHGNSLTQISTMRSLILSQPKEEYDAVNPFVYADFRGMVLPDEEEAIKNTDLERNKIVKLARRTFSQKLG